MDRPCTGAGQSRLPRIETGPTGLDPPTHCQDGLIGRRTDFADRGTIALVEVRSQKEAMVLRHRTMPGIVQHLGQGFDPSAGQDQNRQLVRVPGAAGHRLDHPPPAGANDAADRLAELDVGLLQYLPHALRTPGLLTGTRARTLRRTLGSAGGRLRITARP
jgi:hypothetical protein